MKITELFAASNTPYKWIEKKPSLWTATFTIGDTKYYAYFAGGYRSASIQFSARNIDEMGTSQAVLGGKPSMMVFATMMQITKDFIESRPEIEEISFGAKKSHPSRVKLYDTIAKTLEKRYGYKVEIDDSQDSDVYYNITIK